MSQRQRRARADSASEAVRAMAGQSIVPPSSVPMDDGDMGFFANVLAEFARVEWTAHQLELAAILARTVADLVDEQRLLRTEGYILERGNGTTVENPRSRVVKGLTGDILSLRRSLSLHARARGGETRDIARRRELNKANEVEEDDDLLARPN